MDNKNKKYSIGCLATCIIMLALVIIFKNSSQGLGYLAIILIVVFVVGILYSIFELCGGRFRGFRLGSLWRDREPKIYQKKPMVVSEREREFFVVLSGAIDGKYAIYSQVSLASIVDKKLQNSFRNELFRTIDFVIADMSTSEPLVLVELNDASHLRADRAMRDRKVADICKTADIPLVTFWTKDIATVETVRGELGKYLKL